MAASRPHGTKPARPVSARRAVAGYDSASSMLRALGHYLLGRDTPVLGLASARTEPFLDPFLKTLNRLPRGAREALFTWGGISEALPAERFAAVNAEWALRHMVGCPAVRRGKSSLSRPVDDLMTMCGGSCGCASTDFGCNVCVERLRMCVHTLFGPPAVV